MADESTAQPGVETETNAEAAQPAEVEAPEAEEAAQVDDGDGGEQDEIPEEIELDYGGNKFRLPKGALPDDVAEKLDSFLKGSWSSFTQKTSEVAEQRKSLETAQAAVEKLGALNDDLLDTFSHGRQLKTELEQFDKIDWNALWQSEPDRARRLSDLRSQKQAEFQSTLNQVVQKEQALTHAQSAEVERRMAEGRAQLEKRVKGFTEKATDVVDYVVKNYGLPKDQAERWPLNPATAEMAYKAMLYDQLQVKAANAAKPKPAVPANPVTPVVKGKAANRPYDLNRDADKMSPDEWMKRRNAELRKRA